MTKRLISSPKQAIISHQVITNQSVNNYKIIRKIKQTTRLSIKFKRSRFRVVG